MQKYFAEKIDCFRVTGFCCSREPAEGFPVGFGDTPAVKKSPTIQILCMHIPVIGRPLLDQILILLKGQRLFGTVTNRSNMADDIVGFVFEKDIVRALAILLGSDAIVEGYCVIRDEEDVLFVFIAVRIPLEGFFGIVDRKGRIIIKFTELNHGPRLS